MVRIRVDWSLLAHAPVPEAIRKAVDARLAALWRFLDCSRSGRSLRDNGRTRSEPFRINEEQWTFTYRIDLVRRAAVVNGAADNLRIGSAG